MSSVPFLLPALQKDNFWRGEMRKRLCLLESSIREKIWTNVNFLELSFSSPKFYFSPALTDSLDFWWLKASENAELSQASDSNHPNRNRALVQLLSSPPYLDSVKKWCKSHWLWVCTTKIFHKHHAFTNKWAKNQSTNSKCPNKFLPQHVLWEPLMLKKEEEPKRRGQAFPENKSSSGLSLSMEQANSSQNVCFQISPLTCF